ncbi:unnamed protein product [Absidia cylindrospora]
MASRRKLVYLRITPITHLTVVSGKLVTKKQQDLETSRTINPGGEFSLSYHFKWLNKHQAMLLRDTPAQDSGKKSTYKPMSVYPYQLVVKVEDPHKVDSLYTYFSTAV